MSAVTVGDVLGGVAVLCLAVAGFVAIIFMVALLIWPIGAVACHAMWDASGFPVRNQFWGGCQIQRADGTWIPADAYREIK